jgi:hypothetical protein
VFLPATAPSGVGINEYYKSEEEYFHALAAELNKEYKAIVAAGILVQVDDPFLPDIFFEPGLDDAQKKRRAEIYVEATNVALNGIPAEMVASTPATASTKAPPLRSQPRRRHRYMLKINAGSYSFEAPIPRHEHEYHLFERIKVPDGKVLCPGMITHASNIVEHPELIAERIMRFAKLVGRENVIAGADCGFSSQALYRTEVHTRWCGRSSRRCGRVPISRPSSSGASISEAGDKERRIEGGRHASEPRFAACLRCGGAAAAQESAKIGFVDTFSGPAAVIGNDMRDGFELALDHLGRKVGGLPVQSSTRMTSKSPRSASRRPTS